MRKDLILIACIVFSGFLYFNAPIGYSAEYSTICFIIFLLSSIIVLKNNCKQTIIKFEFFFLIAYFFANISYAVFMYPISPYFGLFFLEFNEDYISKGLALSLVGICCFNYGIFERKPIYVNKAFFPNLKLHTPKVLFILLYVLFIPQLVRILLSGQYDTSFESSYANTMLMYVLYCSLFILFYNSRYLNSTREFISRRSFNTTALLIGVYVILFLLIGSRTIPLRVILGAIFLFSVFIKIPKRSLIFLLVGMGAVLMTVLGQVRGEGGEFNVSSVTNVLDFGKDLIMTNRSVYVLMEYADINGYTLGRTMIMSVLCVIPFAMSIFLYLTGLKVGDINSANLITDLYYDNTPNTQGHIGLGTNIIGDIYVAFGFIGVVILMYFMGYFIRRLYEKTSRGDIIAILLYTTIIMDAIYWPRSLYLTPLRTMAWTLLFFWLYNSKNPQLFHKKTGTAE